MPEKRKAGADADTLMDLIRKKKELKKLHESLDDDDSDTEAVQQYRDEVKHKIKKLKQTLFPTAAAGTADSATHESAGAEAASATQASQTSTTHESAGAEEASSTQVSATQSYEEQSLTQVYVATGMQSREPMWMGRLPTTAATSICDMMDMVHAKGDFGQPTEGEGFGTEQWYEVTNKQKKVIIKLFSPACVTQNFSCVTQNFSQNLLSQVIWKKIADVFQTLCPPELYVNLRCVVSVCV